MIVNMENLIPILTILILLTSCKRAAVEMNGHWHVWEYKDPVHYPQNKTKSSLTD